jgi:hypothetical protein
VIIWLDALTVVRKPRVSTAGGVAIQYWGVVSKKWKLCSKKDIRMGNTSYLSFSCL